MSIKLIAFDLDDTLYNATWLVAKSRRGGLKMMQKIGLKFNDFNAAIEELDKVVQEFGSNFTNHYDILLQRLENKGIIEKTRFSKTLYVAAGVIGYHKVKVRYLKPYRDVVDTLQMLKKKEYKLAIISDGIAVKQYEKLIRLNIVDYFDYIFITDEIGIRKPNPDLFRYCLTLMDAVPEETIYIGDRLDKDIAPANAVGIHSVLVHRGGKYDPNIKENNINLDIKPEFEIHSLREITKVINLIENR